YTCYEVAIVRRPGGKVPPAPGGPDSIREEWHLTMNEIQEREEKGLNRRPKVEPVCRGLEVVDGVPWLHEEGPWYVRIMIPPPGGRSPFPPVSTETPALRPGAVKP